MRFFSILFVIKIVFVFTTNTVFAAEKKGLLWFGLGTAEGKYEEDYFDIREGIEGTTFEYNEYRYSTQKQRSIIPNSSGSTKSFFVHYTLFDPSFTDSNQRNHKLTFTEIIPHWSRGYQYTVHLTDKLDMLTSADLFLGIGLITFEKQIENFGNYDHKFGFDLSYGYAMNWLFKYDDNFFFGWRSLAKNNRITLDYGSDTKYGYLTHRRDILLSLIHISEPTRPY